MDRVVMTFTNYIGKPSLLLDIALVKQNASVAAKIAKDLTALVILFDTFNIIVNSEQTGSVH
jgi:hypothetical protein